MAQFSYDGLTKKLSDDQIKAYALIIKERKEKIKKEPLYKHKFNNYAQGKIRAMTCDFRAITGGNKVGKTDELGFELVAMCKNKCQEFGINFPHKPPLNLWYCGRNSKVLSDEPLNSIIRYLKCENVDYSIKRSGQAVDHMYIWDDEGNKSTIWFKSYDAKANTFESANVHAVFMDEEPPRDIFSAVKTKIATMPGYVFIAMTPDMGLTWTHDLFNGSDEYHGGLVKSGELQIYQGTTFDNLKNFKINKSTDWVRYPEEFDVEVNEDFEYKREDGILYVKAPDTFVKHINRFAYGSDEYKMRILGQYTSFTGHVYPFDPVINTFDLDELPPFSELKFFGALDYGYSDACCFALIALDAADNMYVIDGFYQSYLDARDQAQKMKQVCDYWGVTPEMIAADSQIDNVIPQKDALKPHIQSIYSYYLDELGNNWTMFRREAMDKREPHIKRDAIIRALKDGRLKFNNDENRTFKFIQEIRRLEFSSGKREDLKGEDHFDAALRIFFGANISYKSWLTSTEFRERNKVHWRYQGHKGKPAY